MITKVLNYLQTSSTQMTGQINRLNDILYAALVTGFNSKNVSSITVTGNVATVTTSTDHGYNTGDCVRIEGANESILNDDFFVVSTPSTTTFTFALTTGDFTGTGTITVKIAPLGWERVYTGTNKAVYRAPEGNRLYLRVDDSNAQYAIINAYESMTNVDTGTNGTSVIYWKKSDATSTATREWYLIGNKKTFYLFAAWHASYLTNHVGYAFGEMKSLKEGDTWNTILIGYTSIPSSPSQYCNFPFTSGNSYYTGQYLMRNSIGSVGVITFYKITTSLNTNFGTSGGFTYPNPANNGMELVPVEVIETGNVYRGRLYGLYNTMESIAGLFNSGNKSVVISGRTYMAMKTINSANATSNLFVDIGDWE